MVSRAAALVAEIIDRIEDRRYGTGRPPLATIEVVETLPARRGRPFSSALGACCRIQARAILCQDVVATLVSALLYVDACR